MNKTSIEAISRLYSLTSAHNLPYIGCSSVAAAIGKSTFEGATPLSVYRRIVDNVKPEPSKAMLLGRYFEDGVYQLLLDEYGITCTERQLYVKLPPLHGYIDGVINDTTILEIKTTARGWEVLPEEYKIQANLYMLLAGAQLCTFAVFTFSTQELDVYTISYDDDYTAEVLEQLIAFYRNHVIPRIPPKPQQAKEYRRTIVVDNDKVAEIERDDLLRRIVELKREQDRIEKELDDLKFQLELELGGASKGIYRGKVVANYSQVAYKRIDAEALKTRHPAIYKECLKEEPQLRFAIKYNHIEELIYGQAD